MITVVVPTLNEEEAVGLVIEELRAEGYTNIIVVDGRSTDRAAEIARGMGAEVVYQESRGRRTR